MYEFTTDWFSDRIPLWQSLFSYMDGTPCKLLEIGSFEGRSATWMLDNWMSNPLSTLTCVDGWEYGGEERFDRNVAATGRGDRVTKIKGRSERALRALPVETYDLVYIDGSHEAKDCLVDWIMSWPLARRGGILIFDDYGGDYAVPQEYSGPVLNSPKPTIDAILQLWHNDVELLHRVYQVIVRKR